MKKFEKVFNYYSNLYKDTPDYFKTFGNFSEGVWDHMVTEGLITSYPIDSVVKFIKEFSNQLFEIELIPPSLSTNTIDIYVTPRINQKLDLNHCKKILDSKLKIYGYFIGKIGQTDYLDRTKMLIEPKFPTLLTDKMLNTPFYHITSKTYLDKIKKIGLTPRESTTIFTHPGNRIYLIQTKSEDILRQLKDLLSISKVKASEENGIKSIDKWLSSNMIVLEVDPTGLDLYLDPMFDLSKTYNAVFTQQNIKPDKIKLTSIN